MSRFLLSSLTMTRRRWIADASTQTTASLLGQQADHLARVLRARPGMEADVVVNGFVFNAVIASVNSNEVVFDLKEELTIEQALPITLLMSIFKFDRMEWAIEKATELGVAAIVPIIARRTEKHLAQAASKRVERWRRVAHEAAKQSRRADIPNIADPLSLEAQLQLPSSSEKILLAEIERNTSLRTRIETALLSQSSEMPNSDLPNFEIALGPEGGWASEEVTLFDKHGWQPASLGPRILRAETAAISALAIASSLLT